MKAQAFICGKYADLVINGRLKQQNYNTFHQHSSLTPLASWRKGHLQWTGK
jgi:hypothetical protein